MDQLQQLYQALSTKGMINMSPEEFSQLPEGELMKYASLMQGGTPQMGYGGAMRSKYQLGETYDPPTYGDMEGQELIKGIGSNLDAAEVTGESEGFTKSGIDGKKVAGAAGQIGGTVANFTGNALKDPSRPDSFKNAAGNILSSAGQGAAMGSAFGPWGTLAGAVAGTVAGGIQSHNQTQAYKKDLRKRSEGRYMNSLSDTYNPELRNGGYTLRGEGGNITSYQTMTPRSGDASELNRIKAFTSNDQNMGRFGSGSGGTKLSQSSKLRPAGRGYYAQGGLMPKRYMQDGGAMADAEIEGGEAVLGNPQAASLYGGADATNVSPLGFMAQGAQHGEKNAAGSEGIPMGSEEEMYIGSDKLGLDGRRASKKNKSVAKEMKPYLGFAEKAAESNDPYLNNEEAMRQTERQLSELKAQAEEGKFLGELETMLKKKNRNYDEIIDYIKQENPNDFGEGAAAIEQQLAQMQQPGVGSMDPNHEQMMAQTEQNAQQELAQGSPDGLEQDMPMGPADMGGAGAPQMGGEQGGMDPAMMEQMMAQGQPQAQPQAQGQEGMPMAKHGGTMNKKMLAKSMCRKGCYTKPRMQTGGRIMPEGMQNPLANLPRPDVGYEMQQGERLKRRGAGVIYDDNGNPIEGEFLPEVEAVDQKVFTQSGNDDYMNNLMFDESQIPNVSADNPAFADDRAKAQQQLQGTIPGYMNDYANERGVPQGIQRMADANYSEQIPSGYNMSGADDYMGGKMKMNYSNESFNPGEGPTNYTESQGLDYNKELQGSAPSAQAIHDENNIMVSANRYLGSLFNGPVFNVDTGQPSPELLQMLSPEANARLEASKVDGKIPRSAWNDTSVFTELTDLFSGYNSNSADPTSGNSGSRDAGGSDQTWGTDYNAHDMEDAMKWFNQASENDPNIYGQISQGLNGEQQAALRDVMQTGRWDLIQDKNVLNAIRKAHTQASTQGAQTIKTTDLTNVEPGQMQQQQTKDLTTFVDNPGQTVDFKQAYRKARELGLPDFIWNNKHYNSRRGSELTPEEKPFFAKGSRNFNELTPAERQKIIGQATIKSNNPTYNKINMSERARQANGGRVGGNTLPRVGQRVTFEKGGRMVSGMVKYVNPRTGDFDIM